MIRRSLEVARDHTGAVLVEFTILAPVLVLMLLGVLQFGLLYYYRISMTTAAVVGGRMLSTSRSDQTPYSDIVAAIQNCILESQCIEFNDHIGNIQRDSLGNLQYEYIVLRCDRECIRSPKSPTSTCDRILSMSHLDSDLLGQPLRHLSHVGDGDGACAMTHGV